MCKYMKASNMNNKQVQVPPFKKAFLCDNRYADTKKTKQKKKLY